MNRRWTETELAEELRNLSIICDTREQDRHVEAYLKKQNVVDKFAAYAEKNGLKRRNLMIQKSHKLLERFLVSRIIYNIHSEQAWTEYLNQDDPSIIEALRLFRENAAFPQKPVAPASDKKVAHA